MASRMRREQIRRFAGLSDRNVPVNLSNIENPDLLNVEFSEQSFKRRGGFTNVHEERLFDCSVRFDGLTGRARLRNNSAYAFGSTTSVVSVHVRLHSLPPGSSATYVILSRGDAATASSLFFELSYDQAINTGLGGWKIRAYDAGGTALRTLTVADGNLSSPAEVTRCITFGPSNTAGNYDMIVQTTDGGAVGTASAAFSQWATSTADWIVGAGTSSSALYANANASIAEIRMWSAAGLKAGTLALPGRELWTAAADGEVTDLVGYWRCNDGAGHELEDLSTTANDGIIDTEAPIWETDQALVLGQSGLRTNGGTHQVVWDNPTGANAIFGSGTYSTVSWTWAASVVFLTNPATGRAETGTIFWTGTSATASPLGVDVTDTGSVANLNIRYEDGASSYTLTAPIQLAWLGKRYRVVVTHRHISAGVFSLQLTIYDATGVPVFTSAAPTSVSQITTAINQLWSLGCRLTNSTYPYTSTGAWRGVIDDVKILREVSGNFGISWINASPPVFQESTRTNWPSYAIAVQVRLNEGEGNTSLVEGVFGSDSTCNILPEESQGVTWSYGLVEPEVSPPIYLVADYRRFTAGGDTRRSLLAVSGATLYEIDTSAGSAKIVSGGIPKTGPISSAQYADQLYIAAPGQRRPQIWDGSTLRYVGIQAPNIAPIVSSVTTGGSIPDGVYNVYVTYYNTETGAESNPSPSGAVTCTGGGTSTISQIVGPTSADPQVNARRIYFTAVGAGPDTTAYLQTTINDNNTTTLVSVVRANTLTSLTTASATMSYLDNGVAPAGSVVAVYRDRLFVGQIAQYPTRVYFSAAGELDRFNAAFDYVDADQDTGDPVIAMRPLQGILAVLMRDGRVAITASGNATSPFFLTRLTGREGAVANRAVEELDSSLLVAGERDIYAWDGAQVSSVSSPRGPETPSIEQTLRTRLSSSRRPFMYMARHRSRDQIWIACSSSGSDRNDLVLIYDLHVGVWSKYAIDLDSVIEVEDHNDEPWVYGGVNGRVVKLDDGGLDGESVVGFASGGGTTSLVDATGPFSGDYRGQTVYWYDASANQTMSARIRRNTASTLQFEVAASAAPESGDGYMIGGIPWYADWHMDFGNPITLKKMRWVAMSGSSESDQTIIRVQLFPNNIKRNIGVTPLTYDGAWLSTEFHKRINLGGLARTWRVRVSDGPFTGTTDPDPSPAVSDGVEIMALQFEAEEVSAL
jgi:hypothetical protein